MAGDHDQAVQSSGESDGPTRREFLGTAGIVAAGATMFGIPSASAAAVPMPLGQLTPFVTKLPQGFLKHTHDPRPTCVASTADGNAVSCNDNGNVYFWDLSKNSRATFTPPRLAKASYIAVSKHIIPADPPAVVLTAGFDGIVTVYDLATCKRLRVFDDHLADNGPKTEVWVVAVTPDGKTAVSGTNTGEIIVWDVTTASTVARLVPDDEPSGDEPVASLALLPAQADGSISFLAGYAEGTMAKWKFNNNTKKIEADGPINPDKNVFLHGTAVTVNSIAYFKKGGTTDYAVTASFDSNIRFWDLTQLAETQIPQPIKLHDHFIWRVAVSTDGSLFASVGQDGFLYVFQNDGTVKKKYKKGGGIMGVDFLPNNNNKVIITTEKIVDSASDIEVVPIP